jgi:hypothetical protein
MTTTTKTRPFSLTIEPGDTLSGHQLYVERIERSELPGNLRDKAASYTAFYAVKNYDAAGVTFFFIAKVTVGKNVGDKAILYRNGKAYDSTQLRHTKDLKDVVYIGQKFGWLCTTDTV